MVCILQDLKKDIYNSRQWSWTKWM